jgi:hypothetical protein
MTPIERCLLLQLTGVVLLQEARYRETRGSEYADEAVITKLTNTFADFIQEMPESDFNGVIDLAEASRR